MEGVPANGSNNSAAMEQPPNQPDLAVLFTQKQPSTTEKSISRFDKNRETSDDSGKAQTELKHQRTLKKKTVKELAFEIEESNFIMDEKQGEHNPTPNTVKISENHHPLTFQTAENNQYRESETAVELELLERELFKLKLDTVKAAKEKSQAEKAAQISIYKASCSLICAEALRTEINKVNEEQVMAELASIQALKELSILDANRREANKLSSAVEEIRTEIKAMVEEIDQTDDLNTKLATTNTALDLLHNRMEMLKKIGESVKNDTLLESTETSVLSSLLKSNNEKLERKKKRLATIRQGGFQLMNSMDIIRTDLKHVSEEISQKSRLVEKTDKRVKNLNSRLLRARNKLEVSTASERKENAILSSLSLSLQQVEREKTKAQKEKQLIEEEIRSTKVETQNKVSQTNLMEERMQAALQELELAKKSEAMTLKTLKVLSEGVTRTRTHSSQKESTVTISNSEYEYLKGCAVPAKEAADIKVEAAQEWIRALKASEREVKVKIEAGKGEINELRLKEEQMIHRVHKCLAAKEVVEEERRNQRKRWKMLKSTEAIDTKLWRSPSNRGKMSPSRRTKLRQSPSPAYKHISPRAASFTSKRRAKVSVGAALKALVSFRKDMHISRS